MFKFCLVHFKWNTDILRMIMALIKCSPYDWYGFNTFKTKFWEFAFSFFSKILTFQKGKKHLKKIKNPEFNVVECNWKEQSQ